MIAASAAVPTLASAHSHVVTFNPSVVLASLSASVQVSGAVDDGSDASVGVGIDAGVDIDIDFGVDVCLMLALVSWYGGVLRWFRLWRRLWRRLWQWV